MAGWVQDAAVESTPLSTTGGHIWAAAYRLAAYLGAAADVLGLTSPGVRILELGSGTGWLGVTVARNLRQASLVCLTEQEGGLAWLQHNVQANRARGLPLAHVHVRACDWRQYAGDAWGDSASSSSGGPAGSAGSAAVAADGAAASVAVPGSPRNHRPGNCGDGSELPVHVCQQSGVQRLQQLPPQGQPPQPQPQPQPQHSEAVAQGADSSSKGDGATRGGCDASGSAVDSANGSSSSEGSDEAPLEATPWDFILGSDLIYNEIGSRCLPRVLAALARAPGAPAAAAATAAAGAVSETQQAGGHGDGAAAAAAPAGAAPLERGPAGAGAHARPQAQAPKGGTPRGTQVLYCHTKHRFDLLDMEFFEQLEACGLQWEEVWEPGVPPPPDSPPLSFPPADLFPDQRIAVYRITKRGGVPPLPAGPA